MRRRAGFSPVIIAMGAPQGTSESLLSTTNAKKSTSRYYYYDWNVQKIWCGATLLVGALLLLLWYGWTATPPKELMRFSDEEEQSSAFVLPRLQVNELAPIVWRSDNRRVDQYGRLVGLPPQLTQEIRAFCDEAGLIDLFWSLAYADEPVVPNQSKLHTLRNGRKWTSMTTATDAHWHGSNMHWLDAADEENYEETLQVLRRGGFDTVLDAIGREFNSNGLMVAGMGFMMASYTLIGQIHADLPHASGYWWNLVFPLVLPEKGSATLNLEDEHDSSRGWSPVSYTPNIGVLMGGDTRHGTGSFDYRKDRGLRVAVSIYVVDVDEDNVHNVASDGTGTHMFFVIPFAKKERLSTVCRSSCSPVPPLAIFPTPRNIEWLLAQKGRSWGGGNSLANDKGRKPYSFRDDDDRCPQWAAQGKCDTDLWGVRMECLKSCKIYIEDEQYYSKYGDKHAHQ